MVVQVPPPPLLGLLVIPLLSTRSGGLCSFATERHEACPVLGCHQYVDPQHERETLSTALLGMNKYVHVDPPSTFVRRNRASPSDLFPTFHGPPFTDHPAEGQSTSPLASLTTANQAPL